MTEFRVPELGENVAAGDVTRVLVKVGDTIALEQLVLELETDKATIEVPSSVAGRVTHIKVNAGDTVKVGAVVLAVENGEEKATEPAEAKPKATPEAAGPTPKADRPDRKVVPMPARAEMVAPTTPAGVQGRLKGPARRRRPACGVWPAKWGSMSTKSKGAAHRGGFPRTTSRSMRAVS